MTVAQFANFAKEELTAEALDGYEEMLPEDQARIARAFEEGHGTSTSARHDDAS